MTDGCCARRDWLTERLRDAGQDVGAVMGDVA